jgi:hypothetical protein
MYFNQHWQSDALINHSVRSHPQTRSHPRNLKFGSSSIGCKSKNARAMNSFFSLNLIIFSPWLIVAVFSRGNNFKEKSGLFKVLFLRSAFKQLNFDQNYSLWTFERMLLSQPTPN